MSDCIFCRIVAREVPAKVAAESPLALAFHDIQPQAPVHVLIIPRRHIAGALDLSPGDGDVLEGMVRLAQEVARKEKVDASGFRLVFNSGADAGQAVKHLHLHLLGGRRLGWPPG